MLLAVLLLPVLFLIRGARFRQAAILLLATFAASDVVQLILGGLEANARGIVGFALPLVIAALMIGRGALWSTLLAYSVAMFIGRFRDLGLLGPVPAAPAGDALPLALESSIVLFFCCLLLDRFGRVLRESFSESLARQRELQVEEALRKLAEEQLVEAQRMEALARLSGGIAHDFNNLLTVILGFVDIARGELEPRHPADSALAEVEKASERAAQLTRRLLAFACKQVNAPKVLFVEDRVRSLWEMVERLLGAATHLRIQPSPEPWAVRIDPVQLEQVVMNLLVNARDAMPEGGELTIATRCLAAAKVEDLPRMDLVEISVSDTGTGMTPEIRKRIFEPFFTTKERHKGTGLGLATCYGIVRQSGGAIQVESTPGKGSTFRVFLPRVAEAVEAGDALGRPGSLKGSETILLVEDEEQIRTLASRVLRQFGYTVLAAGDPEQAFAAAGEVKIDLLLTDVVLPRGNGRSIAEQLVRGDPALPVLYMSGYTEDGILLHGVQTQSIDLLAKPFTPEQLALRVRRAIDARA